MKKKLDLNNLLAKYESIQKTYPEDSRAYPQTLEKQFYQTNQNQPDTNAINQRHPVEPQKYPVETYSNTEIKNNFVGSKEQCERILLQYMTQIKIQNSSLSSHTEIAMKQLHENFQRTHQRLRKQILELLDKAFIENERHIKQELKKQSQLQPPEFSVVYRKLASIEQEINGLIARLKGSEYRKAISEIVIRDFNQELQEVRNTIKNAKQNYLMTLGEVEPDRTKIEIIKDNLSKLFLLNKKPYEAVKPKSEMASLNVSESVVQKSGRKSFFNFGGD